MDHDDALKILSDWVEDRLPAETAREVGNHVAGCLECGEVGATLRELLARAKPEDVALFEAHPVSEAIAAYADRNGSSMREVAAIHDHVRVCPTCRHEVEIVRAALTSRPAWGRRLAGALLGARTGDAAGWLRPALAAMVLLMAYPAYVGLFRNAEAPPTESGGALSIVVRPTARDATELPALSASPASIVPVLVDLDLSKVFERPGEPGREIVVEIRAAGETNPTWSRTLRTTEIWDETNRVVTLLVPRTALRAGVHTLSIRAQGSRSDAFEGSFGVR